MNRYISHPIYFFMMRPLVLVLAVVVIVALAVGGYSSCRSAMYDRSDAKHEEEKSQLRQERDAAIRRANEAEAKATLLEAQNAKTDELIDAKGGQIEKAKETLDAKIEEAKRGAGDCARLSDPAAARDCTLNKLKALGL